MVTTTERRSSPRTLGLWMNGAYVGSWSLGTNGPDTLQYDPDWTRAEQGRAARSLRSRYYRYAQ